MPYASYVALLGLGIFLIWSLVKRPQAVGSLLYRQGWLWLTLGISLNVVLSYAPGETALQTLNFVPFFAFYGAIAVAIANFQQPIKTLQAWALGLVLASLPITLRSLVEFYFRAPSSVERWLSSPWLQWLYATPDYGHRADSVFGHPNVLANYLIMVLGLGLGLCAHYLQQPKKASLAPWVYGATAFILVGIFCSGSRNGLLIAGLQLLAFGWWMRRYRFIALAGSGAVLAMFLGVLVWGVGGRTLIQAFETVTLRMDVWRLAFAMIGNNPWIGSGLGTFKLQYEPFTIPIYERVLHPHNLWLMLAAEMGIPLTLLFLAIVGIIIVRGVRVFSSLLKASPQRAMLMAYGLGFAGHLAFAMFDLSFYDSRVNVLGWLMLAVIQGIVALEPASQLSHPKLTWLSGMQSKDSGLG